MKLVNWFHSKKKLNTMLGAAQLKIMALARDTEILRMEAADAQLSADLFQQALTNTFTEKRINDFFDEADRLREVHNNAK